MKGRGESCPHAHFPGPDQALLIRLDESYWHIDHHTLHTCTQNRVPCLEEELEMGFNEKTRQIALMRHSTHHVSVLTSLVCTWMAPFIPFFVCAYSSSMLIPPPTTVIPPGSSPEHPIISLIQAPKALPSIMSPMAVLAITPQSVWGCRVSGPQDC